MKSQRRNAAAAIAPSASVIAGWYAVNSLIRSHHVDFRTVAGFADAFGEFAEFIDHLDSDIARARLYELHGAIARTERQWTEAASHFAAASAVCVDEGWFGLRTAWNELTCRALARQPPQLERIDRLWRRQIERSLLMLNWRAAQTTGLHLALAGHTELSVGFRTFALVETMFLELIQGEIGADTVGPLPDPSEPVRPLDELLAEFKHVIADHRPRSEADSA